MIVDADNPEHQFAYRVVRKDTGEEIPFVFYADTELGEVKKYRVGEDGRLLDPMHAGGRSVQNGAGEWRHFVPGADGGEVEIFDLDTYLDETLRVPFQIVTWPARDVVAEWAP